MPMNRSLFFAPLVWLLLAATLNAAEPLNPLDSGSDELGLLQGAPGGITYNEFTGDVAAGLDVGVPGLEIPVAYARDRQVLLRNHGGTNMLDGDHLRSSVLGSSWHIGFGFLATSEPYPWVAPADDFDAVDPRAATLMSYVDPSGRLQPFVRDYLFQQVPSPMTADWVDYRWIDASLRRITGIPGYWGQVFYLQDVDGTRTEFRPAYTESRTRFMHHYPVRIDRPDGRRLEIHYVGGLETPGLPPIPPAGDSQDLRKRIDRIVEYAGPHTGSPELRTIRFHYDFEHFLLGFSRLSRLTLERPGEPSMPLGSFEYGQITITKGAQSITSVVLEAFVTPEGMRTEFDVGAIRDGASLSEIPALTAVTLATGGRVEMEYSDGFVERRCEPSQAVDLPDTGQLKEYSHPRLSKLRYGGQEYTFRYRQGGLLAPFGDGGGKNGEFRVTVEAPGTTYKRWTDYHIKPHDQLSGPGVGFDWCHLTDFFLENRRRATDGQPVRRTQLYGGGDRFKEEWWYDAPVLATNGGPEAGDAHLYVPLVIKKQVNRDGRYVDTDYDYDLDAVAPSPSVLDGNLIFPVTVTTQPVAYPHLAVSRRLAYEHRYRVVADANEWTVRWQHALGLLTSVEESYGGELRSKQETVYLRSPDELTHWPIVPTQLSEYADAGEARITTFSYYTDAAADGESYGRLRHRTVAGHTTTYEAYRHGVPTRTVPPVGPATLSSVDLAGNVLERTEDGVTTSFAYDGDQRLTLTRRPGIEDRQVIYQLNPGEPFYTFERFVSRPDTASFVDPWGRPRYARKFVRSGVDDIRWNHYNSLGLLTRVEEDAGHGLKVTELTYDVLGRVTREVTKQDGVVERTVEVDYSRVFDGTLREVRTTTVPGSATPLVQIRETDFGGRLVRAETNGHATTFSHRRVASGLETTVTPDGGSARTLVHNWLGDLVEEHHPELGGPVVHDYDARGLKVVEHGPDEYREFSYDGLGRLLSMRCRRDGGAYATLKTCARYDYSSSNNQLVRAEAKQRDAVGSSVIVEYADFNSLNQPTYEDIFISVWSQQPGAASTRHFQNRYTRDEFGRLRYFFHPRDPNEAYRTGIPVVGYLYAYNEGQTAVEWYEPQVAETLAEVALDAKLRPTRIDYLPAALWSTAGATARFGYDAVGRATEQSLSRHDVGGYEYRATGFEHNEWGFLESYVRQDNHFPFATFSFDYTSQGQLEAFSIGPSRMTYAYDGRGNLLSRSGLSMASPTLSVPSLSRAYAAGNPYHRDSAAYDNAGRLTAEGTAQYHYDRNGRLERLRQFAGAAETRYVYDPFGRRVATLAPNRVTYTIRDAEGRVVTEEDWGATSSGEETGVYLERRDYVYLNGRLLAVGKVEASGARAMEWRFSDRLDSAAVRWVGANPSVRHEYAPFGDQMSVFAFHQGPGGFSGHEDDPSGLVYMRARYMDPSAARFTRPDPGRDFTPGLPQTYNLYQYGRNNPVNFVDPDGEAAETAWDVFNIGLGVASLVSNIREGNVGAAFVDGAGLLVDGAAAALPFVPGGASAGIKALRAGSRAADAVKNADRVGDAARAADRAADANRAADAAGAGSRAYSGLARQAYELGANSQKILAIGRRPDTMAAANKGFAILNVPKGWSLKVNDAFIQGVIDAGRPVKLVSPLKKAEPTSVFRRELEQLLRAGYTIKDGWALPPRR